MHHPSPLGELRSLPLPAATVEYYERGTGPTLVFVHGLLANAQLWRKVVPPLAEAGFRCLVMNLPLGSHNVPAQNPKALTPPGLAALIADFLDAKDLHDATIVANDTGGAITQILMTTRPERIGRVVLTNADAFERFFPPIFGYLQAVVCVPGLTWLSMQSLRIGWLRRLPIAYGWLAKHGLSAETARSYLEPARVNAGVRADLRAFVRSVSPKHTLAAAERLPAFDKPVLLAWAVEDRLFPLSLGRRLAERLPRARLVEIADSYTFIPEDQPDRLVELIAEFAPRSVATG